MKKKMWITGIVGACLLAGFAVKNYQARAAENASFISAGLLGFVPGESDDQLASTSPFRGRMGWGKGGPKSEKAMAFRSMVQGIFGRIMVLRSELDVTDEQKQELKSMIGNHKPQIKSSFGSILDSKKALDNGVKTGQSEEELQKLADDFGNSVAKLALEMAKTKQDARKIMTEEQTKKIDETHDSIWNSVDKFRTKMKTN